MTEMLGATNRSDDAHGCRTIRIWTSTCVVHLEPVAGRRSAPRLSRTWGRREPNTMYPPLPGPPDERLIAIMSRPPRHNPTIAVAARGSPAAGRSDERFVANSIVGRAAPGRAKQSCALALRGACICPFPAARRRPARWLLRHVRSSPSTSVVTRCLSSNWEEIRGLELAPARSRERQRRVLAGRHESGDRQAPLRPHRRHQHRTRVRAKAQLRAELQPRPERRRRGVSPDWRDVGTRGGPTLRLALR
jgi:hypothetical protein